MRCEAVDPPWQPPEVWNARIRGLGTSIDPRDARAQQLRVTLQRSNTFGGEKEQELKGDVEKAGVAFIERLQDHLVNVLAWRHAGYGFAVHATQDGRSCLPRLMLYARPCDFAGLSVTDHPVGTWIVDVPEGEARGFVRRAVMGTRVADDLTAAATTPTYA